MFRLICAVAVLTTSSALADPPKFSQGGFNFDLRYGPGWWEMDAAHVAAQAGPLGSQFVGQLAAGNRTEASHTLGLALAYNILGHASLGVDFTATGWNVFNAARGGAGFLTGKLAWHPLELFFLNKEQRPIPLDFNTSFAVGYGIAGGGGSPSLGMDGVVFQWGLDVQYFFARYFALGAYVKGTFFDWRKLYTDFDNQVFVELPNGSGGNFWSLGFTLTFRAGE